MTQSDLKIQQLERQILALMEQVRQLSATVQYLDRERVRTKNEISQVIYEVRSRRN